MLRQPWWKKISRHRGFTLVEIVVALSVVGIMVGLTVGLTVRWMPNYRLRAAARDLYSDFQKAKMAAVKERKNVTIRFFPATYDPQGEAGGYIIFFDDGTGGGTANNHTRDGSEPIIKETTMPKNVTLTYASFNDNSQYTGYNPKSLPFNLEEDSITDADNNVKIKNNRSRLYKLTISIAGNVKLEIEEWS